jgi:hypothetical protein
MHPNSIKIMEKFCRQYLDIDTSKKYYVVDIGSQKIRDHETYRDMFVGRGHSYTGVDIAVGENVDIVGLENIKNEYDILISGQVMEHVKHPWDWLKSLKPFYKKYIVIIAPNTHTLHRYPIDTYRYFPDGMMDLFEYAGIPILEVYKDHNDTVGIGSK